MDSKSSIRSRGLPPELMFELFGSMPLGNAFGLLSKMPNGLLARNVQKMFNAIKEELKNNKLNEQDCGPRLSISEQGIVVSHSGPNKVNSVRAVLSIPKLNLKAIEKPIITSYFEMQILNKSKGNSIFIGYCDHQLPLKDHWHGYANSFGLYRKGLTLIDRSCTEFEYDGDKYFEKGDFVGIGIIHYPNSKMEYFVTWNGKLLVKAKLPTKFANIELFPSLCFLYAGNSILVNFGKEEWKFKDFKRLIQ